MSRYVLIVDLAPRFSIVGEAPAALTGSSYAYAFVAYGGVGVLTWALGPTSDPLPGGWTLSSSGLLEHSGTLGATGAFDFIVRVTDQAFTRVSRRVQITIVDPLP